MSMATEHACAPPSRVLVIEDEEDLSRLVSFNLRDAGFVAETAATGHAGIAAAQARPPAVVLLDLMLPGMPGTDVLRRLRALPALGDTGVIMMSAKSDEVDRVVAFELGADDYVVKPFSVRELVLRVRALARRVRDAEGPAPPADAAAVTLSWRGLSVDVARQRATVDGRALTLRPLELRLLATIMQARGAPLTRREIMEAVWPGASDISLRTIDATVRRLRGALGEHGEAVVTVHGVGYRLADD